MIRSWPAGTGDGLNVTRGLGPVAGDDGTGEPAEHDGVVGGHAGRDRPADPGLLVDVLIPDGPAAHGGDDRGDVTEGEGLRPGESAAGARVRARVEESLGRDRRDVGRVDECLAAPAARNGEGSVDDGEMIVSEVLHHPGGAQDGVRERFPRC
jgi:hypothetical protein